MRTRWVGALSLLFAAVHSLGQPTLLRTDEVLSDLYKQFGAGLPACRDVNQLRDSARDDVRWLRVKLKGTRVEQEYLASLADLAAAVRKVAKSAATESSCGTLGLVTADLHVKRLDCRVMGHSRTNIRVEISTLEGQKEVAGWEVYARWLLAGDRFTTVPKRLQELSSPARGTVPFPGEYEVYAKQSSSGAATDPVRVSIGGAAFFKWPLPVHSGEAKRKAR